MFKGYGIRVRECAPSQSGEENTAHPVRIPHAAAHSGGFGWWCRAREQQAQTASQAYRQGKVAIAKMEGSLNTEFDTTNDKVGEAQAASVLLHFLIRRRFTRPALMLAAGEPRNCHFLQ